VWAGLPLVTCPGTSFAGRVAASLLHAIGLSELVTHDLAAYEAGDNYGRFDSNTPG
jgi:protein O-GlcNAc transferase